MELTVQNVFGLLLRSKLMAVEDARAMYARWQEEAKDGAGDVARFAAWMVAQKFVTEYQAALLARGHAEGFFLNDYKILDRRGKGRMAGVYKAQHQLGQVVAIKVLPPSKTKDGTMLNRFQREAKLAMRLKHQNIVRTFQVGQAGEVHYLVMEYLDGETVEEVMDRRRKLPPQEAVRLIYQALLGLQHIHQQGLVHRDLKPSNMMLVSGPGGTGDSTFKSPLKILDIGLGRTLFEEGAGEQMEMGEPDITGEGVLLGTPDYMAPEQARDARSADIRADIYSLGCVLYHLLSGQPPFPDTNIISQMIRHATEVPKPLTEFNPAVPDGLQQIINWMMAKDPAQRYPTPERAAQALQVFLVAGADAPAVPEDERLNKYLLWVEGQNKAAGIATPTVPALAGAASGKLSSGGASGKLSSGGVPTAAIPALKSGRLAGEGADAKRRLRKGPRTVNRPDAEAGSAKPPPLDPEAVSVDVELVEAPDEESHLQQILGFDITRRDLITFAAGAGAGGLVTLIACLIAMRRREKPAPKPEPTEPEPEKTDE